MTVAIAAVMEAAVLLLGRWLKIRIPIGVTIGLLVGVVAWFANKVRTPDY